MELLKEMLRKSDQVWFNVNNEKVKDFLKFAKNNGCKCINGKEIDVNHDICGFHMGVSRDFKLGYVSNMCWHFERNVNVRKIMF